MFEFDLQVDQIEFDHQVIERATKKAAQKPIEAALGSVKERMLDRLRPGDGPSRPGDSPNIHVSANAGLRDIMLAYDSQGQSGVVGSVLHNDSGSDQPLPGLLEDGGTATIRHRKSGKKRRVRIAPRPYAGPSFDDAIQAGEIVGPWKGEITG